MVAKRIVASVALVAGALMTATGGGSTSAHTGEKTAATRAFKPQPAEPLAPGAVPAPAASKPEPPAVVSAVAPAGTALRVRLNSSIDTARFRPGDRFIGVLVSPVVVQSKTLIPRGARVDGVVRSSSPSGRFKGRAVLAIALDGVEIDGAMTRVVTDSVVRSSGAHKKRNFTLIGGGAGLGALIGGLAAGGRGALIGAGAGAAAGTTGAAITGRKQVRIPAEAVVVFHLRQALTVNLRGGGPELASAARY